MHLTGRSYFLAVLATVLGISGLWSADPALHGLWSGPLALLLAGLAYESDRVRRMQLEVTLDIPRRLFLGRATSAAFLFAQSGARSLTLEYAPAAPAAFLPLGAPRRLRVSGGVPVRDAFEVVAVRLGPQEWPALPVRVLGRLGLAWWSRDLVPACRLQVAPDTLRAAGRRPGGVLAGQRLRGRSGAGNELHQLRAYVPGDPLGRIDWKATARSGALVTRELTEDQHLDILLLLDAGRLSRTGAGALDRLGLYANVAARFARQATAQDDRAGVLVFADRPLALCAPGRGLAAVRRIRDLLEGLETQAGESDVVAAAARARSLLRRRSLVVLLTDLDDATIAGLLARAVRLLAPPHLVLVAGVQSPEIAALAQAPARDWRDPWVALAATEHERRARGHREQLRRMGVPVVAAREERLEDEVIGLYESLRRRRRI